MAKTTQKASPVLIKKYANRRLYDTGASASVTLEDLADMVRQDKDFKVVDAKSGEDLTRSVLVQIIFEQEARGPHMMPVQFLRRLISFYGNNMQKFIPGYLDMSLEAFTKHQEDAKNSFTDLMSGASAFQFFEQQAKHNATLFGGLFEHLKKHEPGKASGKSDLSPREEQTPTESEKKTLKIMQDQLNTLQKQMEALSEKKD